MNLKKLYKIFSLKKTSAEQNGMQVLTQEQIDRLHNVLLMIVDDIMSVIDENNLTCLLGGGSALGAVRHHGFIPWDDDMDINMPRATYDRFIPAFKHKFGHKYWVHTPESNPEQGSLVTKIRLKGTKLKTNGSIKDDSEAGVFVDIFVIENVPDNTLLRGLQGFLANSSKACGSCRKFYRDRKAVLKVMGEYGNISIPSRIRLAIGFCCSFMSVAAWTKTSNKIFSMCKNQNTKLVNIPSGRWHYFASYHDRKSFCKTKKVDFEGRKWPICIGIEDYMQQLYGENYMQVPPLEKREAHAVWEMDLGMYG